MQRKTWDNNDKLSRRSLGNGQMADDMERGWIEMQWIGSKRIFGDNFNLAIK